MPKVIEKKNEKSKKVVKPTKKAVAAPIKKEVIVATPKKKEVVKSPKKATAKPSIKKEAIKPQVIAEAKTAKVKKMEEIKPSKKANKALFKIVQRYEYEDILKLRKFYFYNQKNNQMLFKYFKFIFIFTAIMFVFMKVYELSFFSIVMLVLYPMAIDREIEKTSKMEFETNKLYSLENTYLFHEDYFEEKSEQGNAQIYFNQLHDLVEVEDAYYLFISSNQAYVIKKTSIDENFFNYIKTKPGYHVSIHKTKRLFR